MKKFTIGVIVGMTAIVAVLTQTEVGQRLMSGDRLLVVWESDVLEECESLYDEAFIEGYESASLYFDEAIPITADYLEHTGGLY